MSTETLKDVRGRMGTLMGVQVLGTGSYLPDNVVRNDDLTRLGCDADWIVQRTGIRERRHAPPDMATSDMAVEAARRCLDRSDIDPAEIDLLLVGTFSPDYPLPSVACLVQDRLGLRCPAFDISAACAGFVYATVTGMQFVATGCSRLALVIGADCNSRMINPGDKKTFPLFGDGAGAALLGRGSRDQGLVAYSLGADGSGCELLYRPMGGTRMPFDGNHVHTNGAPWFVSMEGRPIFKWAVRLLEDSVTTVLDAAELSIDDIDLWVLHQANVRIIDAAVENIGIDRSRVVIHLDRYGNTSAGSVPIALDEAVRDGIIQRGTRIVVSGFGAGLCWGTAVLQW